MLRRELAARGYLETGASRHGSIVLAYDELADLDLGEMLDLMVARRERIARSVEAVGKDVAMRNYEDAEAAIDAIKAVIKALSD
ncbi:MAG: hypothetical protein HOV81_17715 [Kofleriaceae bacterium]|nr:hypothetical protein [Kofleriaceae bacterium]